jgi:mono/diheme cytochrome c family protein
MQKGAARAGAAPIFSALERELMPVSARTWLPMFAGGLMALAPDLAMAQQTTPPSAAAAPASKLDVPALFSTVCGWCHTDGGRIAGKGPQLMNTVRSDDFIRNRIKNGKQGAMPAFGKTFSDADIDRIIAYIRNLKPD